MPRSQRVIVPPFNGGLSWSRDPDSLEDDQLRDILNFHISNRGELVGRGGFRGDYLSTHGGVGTRRGSYGHYFERSGLEDQILMIDTGGELWYTDYVGGIPAWDAWTSIATGYGNPFGNAPQMRTYNANVWIGNHQSFSADYGKWDGAARTTYASAPQGQILEVWKERMWVAVVGTDRVYASAIGDPSTFNALDFIDVGKGDGGGITALKTNGDVLMVAKHDRIFAIYDPITFANRMVVEGVGPHSINGITVHEDIFYFVANEGIFAMAPDGPLQKLSDQLDGVFDLGSNSPFILGGGATTACAYIQNHHHIGFLLLELGSTMPQVAVDINLQNPKDPVAIHRVPVHFIFPGMRATQGKSCLYGFASGTNKTYLAFDSGSGAAGLDDGVTFKRQAVTKFYDFDDPLVTKYIRRLKISGSHAAASDKVTLKLFTDWERDTVVKSYDVDFEPSSGNLWNEASIDVDVYCRSLSLHIESTPSAHALKEFWVGGTKYEEPYGTPRIGKIELEVVLLGDRRQTPEAVVTYL